MSRFVLFDPKLTPYVNFSNFQEEKIFHFQTFWDISMRKEQQQNPDWPILLEFGQSMS